MGTFRLPRATRVSWRFYSVSERVHACTVNSIKTRGSYCDGENTTRNTQCTRCR